MTGGGGGGLVISTCRTMWGHWDKFFPFSLLFWQLRETKLWLYSLATIGKNEAEGSMMENGSDDRSDGYEKKKRGRG